MPRFQYELQNIAENCQTDDDMKKFQKRCQDVMIKDMGSRKFLSNYDSDVSIRTGWYYHPLQSITLKSLHRLMTIYYNSVGSNCLLILNIPPNRKGLFSSADIRRLKQMGQWLKKEDECVIDSTFTVSDDKKEINIQFDRQSVDRIRFCEDTTNSQRIEKFKIYAQDSCVYEGTVVGFSKIAIFKKPVVTSNLKIVIEECRKEPYIKEIEVCKTGAYRP